MAAPQENINEEDFIVSNPKEVAQIINTLREDKADLRVAFNGGQEDYVTNIISQDAETGDIYLDMTVDEVFNKRMLNSEYILISKDAGIRIKWQSVLHKQVMLSDGKALKIEAPKQMIRVQRRELFRLQTPIVKPLSCDIPIPNLINPNKTDTITYHLADVSLGGVGLLVSTSVHPSIEVGKHFDDCVINFPGVGEAHLTLEVRSITPVPSKKEKKFRIGMQYVRPTRANENMIHRYTFDLERAMLAARNK